MFDKGARKGRVHSDLNTGSVLLGVVVKRRANVHQQTALYKNCLKVLQGGILLWVKGAWLQCQRDMAVSPGSSTMMCNPVACDPLQPSAH